MPQDVTQAALLQSAMRPAPQRHSPSGKGRRKGPSTQTSRQKGSCCGQRCRSRQCWSLHSHKGHPDFWPESWAHHLPSLSLRFFTVKWERHNGHS